jgi:hypothetical protein
MPIKYNVFLSFQIGIFISINLDNVKSINSFIEIISIMAILQLKSLFSMLAISNK